MAHAETAPEERQARVRTVISGTRSLVRLVYRDPDHVAERMTLYAADALGEQSREWAERVRQERPEATRAELAEEVRVGSAQVARIDGAIAGTPFLIALVPGYVAYLWQEARMTLRIAALYGRDPASMHTAAEVLALRGSRPSVEEAERALEEARATPLPDAPAERRPWRTWFDSVYRLLIFGGFLGPPSAEDERASRMRTIASLAFAGAIWVTTWVLPVTFMIAMSWACESHARSLGRRALVFYGGEASTAAAEPGRNQRRGIRGVLLVLSVAIPIVFVAYVNHVRNTVGFNWLGALGALVAVSLVAATSVVAARR